MKKRSFDPRLIQRAVLKVDGGTCVNCSRAIRRAGAKIDGIRDIEIDGARNELLVDYDGRPEALRSVIALVARLGYEAVPLEK